MAPWIIPFGILDGRIYAAGKDYAFWKLEGEDRAHREQLDSNHKRSLDAVEVYEIEKCQGFQEGDCGHCEEADHQTEEYAFT